ncbi:MAG: hypothetical protein CM1200mP41_16720 [Gammaproteobacteria bacterium]|nr:MAG: hypothetical protein CM1200mP41_16720 [Gammaproteobacteria bacterium]
MCLYRRCRELFPATQDQVAWVVTMNIVATAVVTPMSGWLVVRFGERRVILYCLMAFGLASVGCGVANSLPELVGYRILQGAFGAPLAPVTQTLVQASFPQAPTRPRYRDLGSRRGVGPRGWRQLLVAI